MLLQNLEEDDLQNKLFDVVNQLNQGVSLIVDRGEKNELAKLNLQVGKKAKDSTAYEPALTYLEIALNLLPSDSWKDLYKLTLEIYTEIIEVLDLNGKFEKADILSAIVLENAQEVLDTIKVYDVKIQSYYAQLQLGKAIDTALEILAKLGVVIPSEASEREEQAEREKKKLESFLTDKSIAQLVDLPAMTDPYKLAAIRLLLGATSSANIAYPELYPLFALTTVNLCIKYGNSPLAASVYVLYGQVLCGVKQDIETGYQYGKLALELLEKYHANEARPLVIHYCYGFIRHWKEPFRQINAHDYEEAVQCGLEIGEFEYAGYNAMSYCLFSIFRGSNLEELEPKCHEYSKLILKFQQEYPYYYNEACEKMALNLLKGDRENYHLLFRDSPEEEQQLIQLWIDNNTEWLLFISSLSKTFASYYFKDYNIGLENVNLADKYAESSSAFLISVQNIFYSALTLMAVYDKADPSEQKNLLKRVAEYQNKISFFKKNCPENYQNKYDLIAAEKARVLGQNWQAEELYEKAIQGARKYQFIHEEALAYERAAEFYLALNRVEIGQFYLRNAHHCYACWGAKAKVKQLEAEYPRYFIGITTQSKNKGLTTSISTTGSDGEVLDLNTVLKASQAISGEIKLEKLLEKLINTVIENAGAQKGYLILPFQQNFGQDKSIWVIEAAKAIDSEQVTVLRSIPVDEINNSTQTTHLSTSIFNYVKRTQENLVLNNATGEGQFINDPYIVAMQPKSILCAPLLNQGQLNGIIYLENNLTTGAFTQERIQILTMLSAQAAISIENARLYQTLEDKVAQRTAQLAQANRKISTLNEQLKQENLRMGAELDIARRLQQMVLPSPEELEAIQCLDIVGFMAPADEIGGDYYDVLHSEGVTTIAIGDVTGHGLESGILMLMTQTAVRTLQEIQESDPVRFLDTLNRTIYRNVQRMNSEKNLTLAILNYSEGRVSISGQHEEIIVVRAGGHIESIDTMDLGLPIGIDDDIAEFIDHITVELNPGDGVVLYTDGIPEAYNAKKKQYGMERLCDAISQNWQLTAGEIKQAVIDDVRGFIGEQKVFDDITLVVLKQQ